MARSSPAALRSRATCPTTGWRAAIRPRLARIRYDDADAARLLAVAWDRPVEHITEHVRAILSGGIAELEAAAPQLAPA